MTMVSMEQFAKQPWPNHNWEYDYTELTEAALDPQYLEDPTCEGQAADHCRAIAYALNVRLIKRGTLVSCYPSSDEFESMGRSKLTWGVYIQQGYTAGRLEIFDNKGHGRTFWNFYVAWKWLVEQWQEPAD